jgi:hypothetical protein
MRRLTIEPARSAASAAAERVFMGQKPFCTASKAI